MADTCTEWSLLYVVVGSGYGGEERGRGRGGCGIERIALGDKNSWLAGQPSPESGTGKGTKTGTMVFTGLVFLWDLLGTAVCVAWRMHGV